MGSKKQPSISIPQFNKPQPSSFNLFGQESTFNGSGYSVNEDPLQKSDRLMAEGIRRDLLKSLGLGGQPQDDPYAQLLQGESLRLSQPKLENSLIQRGLGGSSVYGQALAELISRASTEAALGSNQMKLGNLQAVNSQFLDPYYQRGQQLLGMTADQGNRDAQLAAQIYQSQLPYLAQVNMPKQSIWESLLPLAAGAGGFFLGGPAGGAAGYSMAGGGNSQNDLLKSLLGLSNPGQASRAF